MLSRKRFMQLSEEAVNNLPEAFRRALHNVLIIIEDQPEEEQDWGARDDESLLMGLFEGIPATEKSVWDLESGPARVILFQKNIEAVCRTEEEIREEIRLTLLHELGHYFGMSEDQLEDV